jgi:hypothetical protein
VAWPYTDKAGFSQPQAGEFLEEGVNLSGLGLNPCFSSFLLESRSSQSTTATLSDFILGSFQTCDVMLPNQASVSASNFNGGNPITSNQVMIDLNDGMSQLAASMGSGAVTASLTEAQLQPMLAQAVSAWRAAGADPSALSNVANYAIHIANLPDGELGYEVPGQIWFDATAQGWGWSTGTTPAPDQMDLLTVVTHEVGHVLGYGDHAGGNDIMTTTLDAGMRRLPEALSSNSVVASAAVPVDTVGSAGSLSAVATTALHAGELGGAQRSVPPFTLADLGSVEVLTSAAIVQDEVGDLRNPASVPPSFGPQTPLVTSALTAVSAAMLKAPDRDWSNTLVPGLRPPVPYVEWGSNRALPQNAGADADQPGGLAPRANPGDAPFDQDAAGRIDVLFQQWASDASFANGFWTPGPAGLETPWPAAEPSRAAPGSSGAFAALAMALGGVCAAHQPETEPRKRRRFLS